MKAMRYSLYALLVLLSFGISHVPEILGGDPCKASTGIAPEQLAPGLYQALAKAGRDPRTRFVRVVTLKREKEPDEVFDNICRQRLFVSRLITKLSDAGASVIVLDKYFLPTSCQDSSVNARLMSSFQHSSAPIVIGRSTYGEEDLERQHPLSEREREALTNACLVLAPTIELEAINKGSKSQVLSGLIRVNADNRKIPIGWKTFASREDLITGQPKMLPTLPVVAAEVADPQVLDRLARTLPSGRHPYTSFLGEHEFFELSALDLICGGSGSTDWEHCTTSSFRDSDIRAHVVVVGDASSDLQDTVVGKIPGVFLQANYIESLLDDRYFKSVPSGIEAFITLCVIVLLEIVFDRIKPQVALGLAAVLVGLLYVACREVVIQTHYMLIVYFPGGIVLLIKLVDCMRPELHSKEKAQGA